MNNSLKDYKIKYFKETNFDYWEVKLKNLSRKIEKAKSDKVKHIYLMELYSTYLQLLEVFFTNLLIISSHENELFKALFITNKDLKKLVLKGFGRVEIINFIFDNFIFGHLNKEKIKNYNQKRKEHLNIYNECRDDYVKDIIFLNAYKHGYRVRARYGKTTHTINKIAFLETNAEVFYIQKENKLISECTISFNLERVLTKALFVLEMLRNSVSVFVAQGTQVNLKHYYITDSDLWAKTTGTVRWKTDIFEIS